MPNPFYLVVWAIAFGFAWIMFSSMTGLDDALKKLVGRKQNATDLAARIDALERRVAQLEEKRSQGIPTK